MMDAKKFQKCLDDMAAIPDLPGAEERWAEVEKHLDRHSGERRTEELEAAITQMLDAFDYQQDRLVGCVYDARENLKRVMGIPTVENLNPTPSRIENHEFKGG